ncbi:MAG TPA: hypothetical protein VHQ86_01600 [Candidatus Saccharimonadia bacterium]|jgi:hypothetical protein|nr:hypothetical protein [Candidatus Saccharimonadia bacterium]
MDYAQFPKLEMRRKFWKLVGAEIAITDLATGAVVGYTKMKAWKLREDIRIYRDQTMAQELIAIHARQIIDFGATYDVTDSASGAALFSLKRKGFRSAFVRDSWEILDPSGTVVGSVKETSSGLAVLRRWLSAINDLLGLIFAFVPQSYDITYAPVGSVPAVVAQITHQKNPVVVKMTIDSSMAPAGTDGRLKVAAATLLSVIDAAKNN